MAVFEVARAESGCLLQVVVTDFGEVAHVGASVAHNWSGCPGVLVDFGCATEWSNVKFCFEASEKVSEDGCGEFLIHTRYSELPSLKDSLEKEIKIELAKEFSDGPALRRKYTAYTGFPKFPPKRFYNKTDPTFVKKRMAGLEFYFEELFAHFPEILRYSSELMQFLKPKELEVCLIGDEESAQQ